MRAPQGGGNAVRDRAATARSATAARTSTRRRHAGAERLDAGHPRRLDRRGAHRQRAASRSPASRRARRWTSTTSRSRPSTSPTRRSAPGRRSRSASTRRSAGTFTCIVDADTLVPLHEPVLAGRASPSGAHTLRAFAIDVYGRIDKTPALTTFTSSPPPPPAAGHRRRRRRRARRRRQLPGQRERQPGRRRQGRRRRRVRPAAARRRPARAGADRGRARRSPARCSSSCPGRSLKQDGGFIPLKGVASVPVGSTVDARKGELEMKSAANGFAAVRQARQAADRADQGGHVRDPPEAAQEGRGQEGVDLDRHRAALAARRRGGVPEGPGEGHRALAVDGRQGLLPRARRREHRDRPQRDVRHHRPLRRHASPRSARAA